MSGEASQAQAALVIGAGDAWTHELDLRPWIEKW
jgi:hypothetical protein